MDKDAFAGGPANSRKRRHIRSYWATVAPAREDRINESAGSAPPDATRGCAPAPCPPARPPPPPGGARRPPPPSLRRDGRPPPAVRPLGQDPNQVERGARPHEPEDVGDHPRHQAEGGRRPRTKTGPVHREGIARRRRGERRRGREAADRPNGSTATRRVSPLQRMPRNCASSPDPRS